MIPYENLSRRSGITHYEFYEDYIAVQFAGESKIYYYTEERISKHHLETMKTLALSGKGLATYINQNSAVRNNAVTK